MKIAIDARFYGVTGIGRYLSNLITKLENIPNQHTFDILLRKANFDKVTPKDSQLKKVLVDIPWYSFKEQIVLPFLLYKGKYDLVHFPHLNVPVFYFKPYVVTIHDLIMHTATKGATTRVSVYFYIKKFIYKMVVSWAAKRAKKIIVPTNQVKNEIMHVLSIPADKIVVTYEAVDEVFFQKAKEIENDPQLRNEVLHKYKVSQPYFVYLSSFYEHKNHKTLIDAFKKLHDEKFLMDGKIPSLVLIGKNDRFAEKIYLYINEIGLNDHIVLPGRFVESGYVPDEDAIALVSGADLFVCPSKKEGFGINFLEAMALKVPVILSNASCIPEVGGDAAVYFDPESTDELILKIKEVMGNEDLKKELISKGQQKVGTFSWEAMAKQTLGVYESSLS